MARRSRRRLGPVHPHCHRYRLDIGTVKGWQHHELERPKHKPVSHDGRVWDYDIDWLEGKRGWFAMQTLTSGDDVHVLQMNEVADQDDLQMLVEMGFPMDSRPLWHGESNHTVPWDHETLTAKYQEWKQS